jgi:hypothetical protein
MAICLISILFLDRRNWLSFSALRMGVSDVQEKHAICVILMMFFLENEAVFIGLSGQSVVSNKKFPEANGLNYAILSDEEDRVRKLNNNPLPLLPIYYNTFFTFYLELFLMKYTFMPRNQFSQ